MDTLADPKHEAFAQKVACGIDPAAAHRKVFSTQGRIAAVEAPALLADPTVAERIAALQRQASAIAGQELAFGKAQLIAFLVETIQTPVSSIDEHHRQCQEWTRDELSAGARRTSAASQQKTQSEPGAKAPAKTSAKAAAKILTQNEDGAGDHNGSARSPGASESETSITAAEAAAAEAAIMVRSKTKMPGKLDAAKLLATVCGWNAPTKVEGKVNVGISPTVNDALSRLLE